MSYPFFLSKQSHTLDEWFGSIADELLCRTAWYIAGEPHRLTEIELYYHEATDHPDPFTHCDPLQLSSDQWYFHRKGGIYKAGSFKGLDITFGSESAYGGILIRGLEKPNGTLVDGPCLCVNYLLNQTGFEKIAELDAILKHHSVWDETAPTWFTVGENSNMPTIYTSPRIGLTLKRDLPGMEQYVFSPYRFLTEPKRIKKGKPLLTLQQLGEGNSCESIREISNSPLKTIRKLEAAYRGGKGKSSGLKSFKGKDWTPIELAEAYGAWTLIE